MKYSKALLRAGAPKFPQSAALGIDMENDPQNVGLDAIGIAIENGELVFGEESKGVDFDRACDHSGFAA